MVTFIPSPLYNKRPDLVSPELNDSEASHASEHDASVGDPNGTSANAVARWRLELADKRLGLAKSILGNPKLYDPWIALQVERNEKAKVEHSHKEAFSQPRTGSYYPYWGVSTDKANG